MVAGCKDWPSARTFTARADQRTGEIVMDNLPAPPNPLPGDFCKMTPGSFSRSEWFDLPILVADVLHPTIGALSISTDAPSRRPRNLSSAITGYQAVMNTPRGQIVNRSTLLKEVETDTADLMVQLSDLDDLSLQFNGTDAGRRFIEAWKRARNIVDAGHGPAAVKPAPAPAAPTPKV